MADRALFISWGMPVRGLEVRGLDVFNDALGLFGRMQQEGRIEGFDVTLLRPHARTSGYIQVKGSAEQIAAIREDEEFIRNMLNAQLVVDDLSYIDGYTNAGVAAQMERYQEAVGRVPQRA